ARSRRRHEGRSLRRDVLLRLTSQRRGEPLPFRSGDADRNQMRARRQRSLPRSRLRAWWSNRFRRSKGRLRVSFPAILARSLVRLSLRKGEGRVRVLGLQSAVPEQPLTLVLSPLRKGRGGKPTLW